MDLYAKVRRAVMVEDQSERATAKRFGISRKTVSKMIICRHDAMSVYRCPHCGGWHVGHRQTAQRRTRRKDFL